MKKLVVYTRFNQFLIDKGFTKEFYIYTKNDKRVKGYNLVLVADCKTANELHNAIRFFKLKCVVKDV